MSDYKIIFSGPVGSGKTTAIESVSDIPVVSTEERASDETARLKTKTTVAMDYGVIRVNAEERVHLFGTPGQKRFDFMWDILATGGIGLILLIRHSAKNRTKDLDHFLGAFSQFLEKAKVVVGVTHTDQAQPFSLAEYHKVLSDHNINTAVFEVDAREKRDVSMLIEALLCSISPEHVLNG